MSQQVCSPPQDTRVRLTYATKEEAGRFAVASTAVSPGELVLTAAPYGLVMNPRFCPSALYLSARCVTSTSGGGEGVETDHASPGKSSGKAGKSGAKPAKKKATGKATAKSEGATDPAAQLVEHYKDALYGCAEHNGALGSHHNHSSDLQDDGDGCGLRHDGGSVGGGLGGTAGAAAAPPPSQPAAVRWYTTHPTWCAACFQEISSGRWLCNRGSLAELAVDLSHEQAELEQKIRKETQACGVASGGGGGGGDSAAAPDAEHSDGEEEAAGDAQREAAAFKKLKKPSKSAKTRKDGAVALKQKLIDMALAQREEVLYQRRLQRRAREQRGAPLVRLEGWEALLPNAHDDDKGNKNNKDEKASRAVGADGKTCSSVYAGALSGCSGCGVLCYCSELCWRTHHREHVDSGECAVLRALYPRLMADYYSTGVGSAHAAPTGGSSSSSSGSVSGGGGGATSQVVLPGNEALHWTRSSSEAKMLEFQSLLFSAVVVARACRDGYAEHLGSEESRAGEEDTTAAGVDGTETDAAAAAAAVGAGVAAASPSSSPAPPPPSSVSLSVPQSASAATTSSTVIPREVTAIEETRAKAGLTGTVEMLDSAPELRHTAATAVATATAGDDGSSGGHGGAVSAATLVCVFTTSEVDREHESGGEAVADSASAAQMLCARQPRYADMAQMETNLAVISKARRSFYQRYYRTFTRRVLPVLQAMDLVGSTARLRVSESYFLRLCAAAQCNSFGVYDTHDHCLAFGVYPEASYFNHSCVPNICRVMHHGGRIAAFYALRPIASGEALTISYTDVEEQNSAERRRNLLETYRFFCMCERCSGHAEGPVMALSTTSAAAVDAAAVPTGLRGGATPAVVAVPAALFDKPLLLCAQCAVRGYLRPMCPRREAKDATWSMADVQVRVCTMCHCRVVRQGTGACV